VQANLAVQEARLGVATAELDQAQGQLDEKQRELDAVQALYDAAMKEKQVGGLILQFGLSFKLIFTRFPYCLTWHRNEFIYSSLKWF